MMKGLSIVLMMFLTLFSEGVAQSQEVEIEEGELGSSAHGLTLTNPWETNRIPVCWENPAANNQTGRRWVQIAITNTWEKESALTFINWDICTDDSEGIRILIEDDEDPPHAKSLGYKLNGKEDGVSLNFTFENWNTGCKNTLQYCIQTIAVHEIGHALGFAHEHNRQDAHLNCQAEHQGTDPVWTITPYDVLSVMNYCNPRWAGDGKLSKFDIKGVQQVYGAPGGTPTPLASKAFVHFFDKRNPRGVPICTVRIEREYMVVDFDRGENCEDDEAQSMLLQNIPPNVVLFIHDEEEGDRDDDWLEIQVKRHIDRRFISSFEHSIDDDQIRMVYHHSDNDLNGEVSRLEIHTAPAGPIIDLYDELHGQGDLMCSIRMAYLENPGPPFIDFGEADCDNNEAESIVLYDVPKGKTLLLFDDSDGDRNEDWLEVRTKQNIVKKVISSMVRSFEDHDVKVQHHGEGELNGEVSRLELASTHCPLDSITRFGASPQELFRSLNESPARGLAGQVNAQLAQNRGALVIFSDDEFKGDYRFIPSHTGSRLTSIPDLGDWNDEVDSFLFFSPSQLPLMLHWWEDENFEDDHTRICATARVKNMDDQTCDLGACGDDTMSLRFELP